MTNPGIAAPLSRVRHQRLLEEVDTVQGKASEFLDELDQALADVAPISLRRRVSEPR